ncbi:MULTISPECIES: hypothetical protein [unclassified Mesorhizobium]|uniref:hypothetical protein n=1 Tax=unclassified Mesorhizobium TaxID=325217 RepID=UPI001FDEAA73|nr:MULTISPECIES: hypothetical protein [unclassified Mesorhizobium]
MNSVPEAERIRGQDGSVDVSERRREYEASGWSEFNPDAPAYGPDEVECESVRCAALGRLPEATSATKGAVIEKAKLPADQAPAGDALCNQKALAPNGTNGATSWS